VPLRFPCVALGEILGRFFGLDAAIEFVDGNLDFERKLDQVADRSGADAVWPGEACTTSVIWCDPLWLSGPLALSGESLSVDPGPMPGLGGTLALSARGPGGRKDST
jgi:hypothetical protein